MQKADLSNLGDVYLMDIETGEKIPWNGITEISDDESFSVTAATLFKADDSEIVLIPQEVADKLDEAAVSICSTGQKIHETILAMVKQQETFAMSLRDAFEDTLPDDKTPNPIYIPKHIKHRKKGRR